jgi:hypothetical protein
MILLDDYNQNHLNDGLVITNQRENNLPLPSYASRNAYRYDTSNNLVAPIVSNIKNDVNTYQNKLTRNQIYAAQEIMNVQQNVNNSTIYTNKKYFSNGPFVKDVFALIPMKTTGLQNNSVYIEFGGTLQQQERVYFGPVNISRMNIKLINDKGEMVDLNNANWSMSLIIEQLYQQKKV